MQRKAIIIGATGRVGQALTRELCALYETVIVVARTMPKCMSENMQVYALADFDNLTKTLEATAIDDKTDAFCCLWTPPHHIDDEMLQKVHYEYPKQFATLCYQKGVRSLFLLSKAGASLQASQKVLRMRGQLHHDLSALSWRHLVIFMVQKVTLSNTDHSLKGLGKKAIRFFERFLPTDEPLTPTQIGVCMALTAFDVCHQERLTLSMASVDNDFSVNIHYIHHKQMLLMTTIKTTSH